LKNFKNFNELEEYVKSVVKEREYFTKYLEYLEGYEKTLVNIFKVLKNWKERGKRFRILC